MAIKEDEKARVKAEQRNRMDARAEAYEETKRAQAEQDEKERDIVKMYVHVHVITRG